MSVSARRVAVVVTIAISTLNGPAQAADPFPLVRGLRDNGMADLALQYITETVEPLAAKDPAIKELLVLERAKTLLASADQTENDNERTALLTEARVGFDQYLKGNPPPALAAEAAVAIARVITLQAETQLGKAAKAPDKDAEKAEALKARPLFEEAAKRLVQAATQLETVLTGGGLAAPQEKALRDQLLETRLDAATTKLRTAETFIDPNVQEVKARGELINAALEEFKSIAANNRGTPAEYIARAWIGQCQILNQAKSDYEKTFADMSRVRTPAAAAGVRLARFFEAKLKYDENDLATATKLFVAWLKDYGRGRPTRETHAARYYYYLMQFGQVLEKLPKDADGKIKYPLAPTANSALREIERGFRRLTQVDNEFTEKASKVRLNVVRFIVGDAAKKPSEISDFDECVMTALVKFQTALESEDKDERTKELDTVVGLLERALELPAPPDSTKDIRDTKLKLVSAYLLSGRPYSAAVLGEFLARTAGSRGAGAGALAGFYGIQSYLAAAEKAGPTDASSKKSDEHRAMELARYMHDKFPLDPNTDLARFTLGQLMYRDGVYLSPDPKNDPLGGAFDAYAAVNIDSSRGFQARLLQGVSAFEILRPTFELPDAEKKKVFAKIIADLKTIPKPPLTTPAADARLYIQTQLLLAQLYLMAPDPAKWLPEAEKLTNQISIVIGDVAPVQARAATLTKVKNGFSALAGGFTAQVATTKAAAQVTAVQNGRFASLSEDARKELSYQTEEARLRAVYGAVAPLFQKQQYKQVMAKLTPELARMQSVSNPNYGGTLKTAAERLDEFRREKIIVLALQTRIREGNIESAQTLFNKLKEMGGSLDATINSLTQLLALVRPQIEDLRKKGDDAKPQLDKLIAGIASILDQIAKEKNLGSREKVFLGRSLKDIGSFEQAIPILEQIPAPANLELLKEKNPNMIADPEARLSVIFFRGAQLELARAYRLSGKTVEAEAVLKDAMGDDANPGWAKKSPDFRKEMLYTMEDKAEAITVPKEAQPIWDLARRGWGEIAGEYQAFLSQPIPADPMKAAERNRLVPQVKALYFDAFYEYLRCLTRANSNLLSNDPGKLATSLGKLAAAIDKVDKSNPDLPGEVRDKFSDLLKQYPVLKDEYIKAGGTGFLKAESADPGTTPAPVGPGGN